MCGIAGWVDYMQDLGEKDRVSAEMAETLKSRGPDEGGTWSGENACLIHRRLIVIDPEHGAQPMEYEQGDCRYTLVYNGELYNTGEVRRELRSAGHEFQGHSDTEVLLHAYAQWKEGCLSRLNGIYAFAVWEQKERRLFAARDRMGVKPFFMFPYGGGLVFASQIRALMRHPRVRPQIDEEGLKSVFLLGPGRPPGEGVFKGVMELKPGEYLVFDRQGLRIRTYWAVKAAEHPDGLDATVEKTRFLIEDAIRRQLVSDVPLCCFLSGGLDSSIISGIAADSYRQRGERLSTYSVDYRDNRRFFQKSAFQPDADTAYIELMTRHIGSDHKTVTLENRQLAEALAEAAAARDLPGMADIDSSLLLFCHEIKKHFTVALSGECADEVFGGYPWYHDPDILFSEGFPWSRSMDIRYKIVKKGLLKNAEEYVRGHYADTVSRADVLPSDSETEKRMRRMFMLNMEWFMQTLLDRKDRMSMASGLEVRVPFCDHRIVEYAYNMPWRYKSLGGREKGIVREAMGHMLPREITDRKKSPYPKTHSPAFMEHVTEMARAVRDDKTSAAARLIDWDGVQDIIDHPEHVKSPWYGQLMGAPQILGYIVQIESWFREFDIEVVGV